MAKRGAPTRKDYLGALRTCHWWEHRVFVIIHLVLPGMLLGDPNATRIGLGHCSHNSGQKFGGPSQHRFPNGPKWLEPKWLRKLLVLGEAIRKILVSIKFLSAILGPEMAAPILWTRGKMRSFCRKTHVNKIPRFRGGGIFWVLGGGGKCRFYFYGRKDFSEAKPGGFQTRVFPTFFWERSRLCSGPFRDCSS